MAVTERPVSTCDRCRAVVAPAETFLSLAGETLCRSCNSLAQMATADSRAQESFAQENPGLQLAPASAPAKNPMGVGIALMGIAAIWLVAGMVLADKIYFFPFIFGLVGFGAVARGLALRKR